MCNQQPTSNSNSQADSHLAVELSIAQERIRQAHHSFNLAFGMTAASALISLVGVILLFSGQAQAGTVAATGGLASSVRCLQLAKDANDRLDKVVIEMWDED